MDKKKNSVFQTWLFLGPEIGEKQNVIEEIRKKLLAEDPALEETVYYAGETSVSAMVSNILNASLFASSRLFFIKCAEEIKKKADTDLLSSCLEPPPDHTYVIFISEETSAAKALEKIVPTANKRIFWELSDSRKYDWVSTFFRQNGFKISPAGIETILELVENNTAALKQECSRLALFLDKNREITEKDAEKWLSHTRQESAFTLFSRIAAGDFSRSLESARVLLAAKETPPAIFACLASCFRKLLAYLSLKQAGVTDDWEYKKIGVSAPAAKRDYASAARFYSYAAAESCLALTAEYDLLLRSAHSFPEQILMDQFLYKIYSLAR